MRVRERSHVCACVEGLLCFSVHWMAYVCAGRVT